MPGSPKKAAAVRQGHARTPQPKDLVVRETGTVVPMPPAGLLERSRRRWVAYWESPVARAADPVADLHRVERWIRAVDEYERVYPVFVKERTVEGSTGQVVLNPLGGYVKTLEGELARAETELGLTPTARLKLGLAYGQAKLTAAELNKALAQGGERRVEAEAEYAEWRDVDA